MINDRSNNVEGCKPLCCVRRISWSAIVVGTLVAIGLSFLLQLFGLSIGLEAFTRNKEGMVALAIGGYIGMVIGTIVVMFIAGWVAGYLGRAHSWNHCCLGAIYGFSTWCLALVVMAIFASHINILINTSYHSLMSRHMMDGARYEAPYQASDRMNQNERMTSNEKARNSDAAASSSTAAKAMSTEDKVAKALGISFFLMFLLFFIGALSSCFGGYFGIKSNDKCREGQK